MPSIGRVNVAILPARFVAEWLVAMRPSRRYVRGYISAVCQHRWARRRREDHSGYRGRAQHGDRL